MSGIDQRIQFDMKQPPTEPNHLTTKEYVDLLIAGRIKEAVTVATTADLSATYAAGVLTASTNGAITVDGISLSLNDRVLVKDQTTATENGIYTVTAVGDAGTPFELTRADDFNADADITSNVIVPVIKGTTNADKRYQLTSDGPFTIDTTNLVFALYYTTVTGTVTKETGTINGDDSTTTFAITHGINSNDIVARVYDTSTNTDIGVDIKRFDVDTVHVSFGVAPATGEEFKVVITG